MKDQTKIQLREEFAESFKDLKWSTTSGTQDIADFWLSKIDSLLQSQRDELVEKIEKEEVAMHGDPENLLEYVCKRDIISLIKQNN